MAGGVRRVDGVLAAFPDRREGVASIGARRGGRNRRRHRRREVQTAAARSAKRVRHRWRDLPDARQADWRQSSPWAWPENRSRSGAWRISAHSFSERRTPRGGRGCPGIGAGAGLAGRVSGFRFPRDLRVRAGNAFGKRLAVIVSGEPVSALTGPLDAAFAAGRTQRRRGDADGLFVQGREQGMVSRPGTGLRGVLPVTVTPPRPGFRPGNALG